MEETSKSERPAHYPDSSHTREAMVDFLPQRSLPMLRKGGGHVSPGRSLPSHSGSPSAVNGAENSAGTPVSLLANSSSQSWLGKSAVRSSQGEGEVHRLYSDLRDPEEDSTILTNTENIRDDDSHNDVDTEQGGDMDVGDAVEQRVNLYHKKMKHRQKFLQLLNMK